jgi:hypothetical protein
MTTTSLLSDLQRLGVDVTAKGDKLVINAPKGVLTPEIRARIAEQKVALLALLSAQQGYSDVSEIEEKEELTAFRPGETPEPYKRFIEARKRLGGPMNVPLRVITPRGKGICGKYGGLASVSCSTVTQTGGSLFLRSLQR